MNKKLSVFFLAILLASLMNPAPVHSEPTAPDDSPFMKVTGCVRGEASWIDYPEWIYWPGHAVLAIRDNQGSLNVEILEFDYEGMTNSGDFAYHYSGQIKYYQPPALVVGAWIDVGDEHWGIWNLPYLLQECNSVYVPQVFNAIQR